MSSKLFVFCLCLLWIGFRLPCCGQTKTAGDPDSKSHGIRRLAGQYITLFTDLPKSDAIDELPRIFDAAVPQWCKYFSFSKKRIQNWHQTGYLILSKERFRNAGFLPADLPPFLNGYQRGSEFWVYAQPSDYYVRHLLLHEGTHAFMFNHLRGGGPAWYSEGVAELLGSHQWKNGHLQLGWLPDSKTNVPYWGRIKIIKDDLRQKRGKLLEQVFQFEHELFRRNEAYAWSWAASAFLDAHPDFQKRFRLLRKLVSRPNEEFSAKFDSMFQRDRRKLDTAWQVFVTNLDYGYAIAEDRIIYDRTRRLPLQPSQIKIDSRQGWQSSGFLVDARKKYRITANGRFVIRQKPQEWACEPGGVTIRYYRGRPLGMLMAGIENENGRNLTGLIRPQAVGLAAILNPKESGTLFFRLNEPAGQLGDNQGAMSITIEEFRPD